MNLQPQQFSTPGSLELLIDEGAQNRRDIRDLNQNFDLNGLIPVLIAHAKGRPLHVDDDCDRRSLQAMPTEGQVLKGLFRMFAVNEQNQFQKHRAKFDAASIRETSIMEIERLGTGRRYGGRFSPKQVKTSLKLIADAGFITRWREFNPTLIKSKLFIRLNARKIIQTLETIKILMNTKMTVPRVMPGQAKPTTKKS
jgi:hypothetical protein